MNPQITGFAMCRFVLVEPTISCVNSRIKPQNMECKKNSVFFLDKHFTILIYSVGISGAKWLNSVIKWR